MDSQGFLDPIMDSQMSSIFASIPYADTSDTNNNDNHNCNNIANNIYSNGSLFHFTFMAGLPIAWSTQCGPQHHCRLRPYAIAMLHQTLSRINKQILRAPWAPEGPATERIIFLPPHHSKHDWYYRSKYLLPPVQPVKMVVSPSCSTTSSAFTPGA